MKIYIIRLEPSNKLFLYYVGIYKIARFVLFIGISVIYLQPFYVPKFGPN